MNQIGSGNIFITHKGIVYQFYQKKDGIVHVENVVISFVGADGREIDGLEESKANFSYIKGNELKKWVNRARAYTKLIYNDLYPGIDLLIYGSGSIVEHEYRVKVGGDAQKIVVRYEGVQGIRIDENTNVGEVEVWNDGDYLYVKYVTDGWYITEVHLHVAISKDGIPQKNGNPIPGKFTYSEEGLWTTEYDFDPIPLNSWSPDTALYIAAHTKVREAITTSVVSQAGVMAFGPSPTYLAVGDSGWGSPKSAVATWEHPSWPLIPGATWISTEYEIPDARLDSWRWFSDSFDVPRCPASGTVLLATSDNAEEVYLNGALIGSDGEVQETFIDNWEWGTVVSYPFTPQEGSNTLDFIVRNYAYDTDDPHLNPTGLIYKAEVECYGREETAWGAGSPFPGKNWATYFTYDVQGWQLLETIQVPAMQDTPTYTSIVLETGMQYKVVASGTAFAGGNYPLDIEFDAEYSYTWSDPQPTDWVDGVAHYESYGVNLLDLEVDGEFVDWGPYNPSHVYEHTMEGTGNLLGLALLIYDIYYPNNGGHLTVEIYVWQ